MADDEFNPREEYYIPFADQDFVVRLGRALQVMSELETGRMADEEKMEVEILISIITFRSNINVHLPATSASHVKWKDLTAYGETKMGGALKKAKEMIEDKEITPSRSYRPTIVLVSDGRPGDVWEEPLNDLAKIGRSQKCDRMAMAIGQDADEDVLKRFIDGTEHELFYANNAKELHEFFRYVTMSVTTRTRSQNPNQIPSANDINSTLKTEPTQVSGDTDDDYNAEAFLIKKEIRDRDLSIKLRAKGKIIT